MSPDHLSALLAAAEAKKDEKGWSKTKEGRLLTLYVAANGASLSVSKVQALRVEGMLVHAKTVKEELFILALETVYAGAVEAPASAGGRKAGFV
jgi:hypothetical protein